MKRFFSILILFFGPGCAYQLTPPESSLLKEHRIRNVYVYPIENQTNRTRVEIIVLNALTYELNTEKRIRIVYSFDNADAILFSDVFVAEGEPRATFKANSGALTPPAGTVTSENKVVATQYQVVLSVRFRLAKIERPIEMTTHGYPQNQIVWEGQFTRNQFVFGSAGYGAFGSTNGLINESEVDSALRDLALQVSSDGRENMLLAF